jgi:succinoglycan biosynthesis transport protein ExoP
MMNNALVPIYHEPENPAPEYGRAQDSLTHQVDAQPDALLGYWRMLRRHKGTLLLFAFAGVLAAILITLSQTPVYRAQTNLEIKDLNAEFMNMKQLTPVTDDSGGYNALADLQTQIRILQSETLAGRVLAKLKINSIEGLAPQKRRFGKWRRVLNLPEPSPITGREPVLTAVARNLQVRAVGDARIVEVLFDSTDPDVAAAFVNTLASEFIAQNMEDRWQLAQRTGDWLNRQLGDMRTKLEKSDDALKSYARQNSLVFARDRGDARDVQDVAEQKLYQLQEELSSATSDRMASQSLYETARAAPPESLSDVVATGNPREPRGTSLVTYKAMLQMRLTELRSQEANLAAMSNPDDSKLKQVRAEIATLSAALVLERSAILERIHNAYVESLRREELLKAAYADQVRLVTQDSEKSIQYNILKRDMDSNRQSYEAMLQRVRESTVASAMKASNVRIIDPARIPETPYKPSFRINGAVGLLAGIMLSIVFIIKREQGNPTVHEPGDASLLLGVPELGVVSTASAQGAARGFSNICRRGIAALHPFYPRATRAPLLSGERPLTKPRNQSPTRQKDPSPFTESFRSIVASIMFMGHDGSRPRVLVITSANPMDGKSTVAANLAIGLAKANLRVLAIDGDLRKPSLHEICDVDNSSGLIEFLKQCQLNDGEPGSFIRETSVQNLDVLTGGQSMSVGSYLLFSGAMASLIARCRQRYDIVIIDTPPMLQMPDARLFGQLSDGVVMVVRAGKTSHEAAVAARQRLKEDGTRVLGVVLNDWNPRQALPGYRQNKAYLKAYYDDAGKLADGN